MARVLGSPHDHAPHTMLVADGCAGRVRVIAQLAAHLCGYSLFQSAAAPAQDNAVTSAAGRVDAFKADIMVAFKRAGIQVCG